MDVIGGVQREDERLEGSNEGNDSRHPTTLSEAAKGSGHECTHETMEDQTLEGNQVQEGPPSGYENTPPELWPGPDGKPPELTAELVSRLRSKYFTVRHPKLVECGHRLDMINEPRHRNCENCWWTFFNTHPQLVETADQFFRTQGKEAMIGMRGTQFVKMFVRFMSTVHHFLEEEKKRESHNQETVASGTEESGSGGSVVTE